jgi:histidine triad (HIT) family protein
VRPLLNGSIVRDEAMSMEAPASCVFCRILRGELTPDVVAFRDGETAVFPSLHQQPRNRGHMLVVPTRHVAHLYEIGDGLAGPLMMTLARGAAAVKKACRSDGVSVRQNNEQHGGQDVFHVHFHVIPRFAGDGFTSGADQFPLGAVELPLDERLKQAAKLSEALGSPVDKLPRG